MDHFGDRPPRQTSQSNSLDAQEVKSLLSDVYGLEGFATPLPGEFDDNWRLETKDATFRIRISHPTIRYPDVVVEIEALAALSETSISTPVVVPTRGGDLLASTPDGRVVRVLTWVNGVPYSSTGRSPELDCSIGRFAGHMVLALGSVDATARSTMLWNVVDSTDFVRQRMTAITDPHRRSVVWRAAEDVERDVHVRELPMATIHNDLNDLNVLVDGGVLAGVIDFGDLAHSYRIAEPAIAATYAMFGRRDPLAAAARVVTSFVELVPIGAEEARSVFDLIRVRLAMSISQAASELHTNNDHQQVSADDAWEILERLDAADRDYCSELLASAGGHDRSLSIPGIESRRASVIGPSLSLSYSEPLHMVLGRGTHLFDHRGRRYLDCVNNVCHVGHCHPHVVEAAARQMATLNTNTRYLHPNLVEYGERLVGTFDDRLTACFLVNSGTEANELAVRLARAATGQFDMAVFDHAYHGNSTTTIDLSPYKFAGPGGSGRRDWVHVMPVPDSYRGLGGDAYRAQVAAALENVSVAGLIAESLSGCGGHLVPAAGSLADAYDAARNAGGVVIADEVQTGFGRVGEKFWAFQLFDVQPDIVTMGKPIGNGHPLGAVVTTRKIAEAFNNGMEYFNTFGGNPVSAAVGNAVLDVIENEALQANAAMVGTALLHDLQHLGRRHGAIGDVRGAGLFIGIDVVSDFHHKTPDPATAEAVIEYAVRRGILLSLDGPGRNVVKIKPPLVFSSDDAHLVVSVIDDALSAR